MGIPRFAYRMREYARTEVIGSTDDAPHKKIAVIDGPSLAHSIFNDTKDHSYDTGVIYRAPNYTKLAESLLEWLDRLQYYGFEIEGIYFDGALPSYKQKTRLERLQKHVDGLIKFKWIYDDIQNANRNSRREMSADDTHRIHTAQRDLSSPPFLVCAVIEILLESRYAERTWIVPGEADPFCAVAARDVAQNQTHTEVTIFTNDSDLIIYDSGLQTRVTMINSVDEGVDEGRGVLRAVQFSPASLRKLSLKPISDLIGPAYEMLSPDVSFREALGRVRFDNSTPEYRDFVESYSLHQPTRAFDKLKTARNIQREVVQTDPRLSEWIHEAINESKRNFQNTERKTSPPRRCAIEGVEYFSLDHPMEHEAGHKKTSPRTELPFYLPTLFEDPSRGTAWKIGAPFRNAAAALIQRIFDLNMPMLEYRRSGDRIRLVTLEFPLHDYSADDFLAWKDNIDGVPRQELPINSILRWRFLVMRFTLLELDQEARTLPVAADIVHVINNANPTTWNQVHLSAQFQAEYYSLRMFREILNLHSLLHLGSSDRSTSYAVCASNSERALHDQLLNLPSIGQFFAPASEAILDEDNQGRLRAIVEDLLMMIDPKSAHSSDGFSKCTRNRKRTKARAGEAASNVDRTGQYARDNNPFSSLAQM